MQKRSSIPDDDSADPGATSDAPGLEDGADELGVNKVKNPAAVALGHLGGLKGGPARAAKLTPEQRSEVARKAAAARWSARRK